LKPTDTGWVGVPILPVEQVRILDEPTAAALGYGMVEQENLLVIDFGVERWIYPLYGWMGRPSRQKAAGVYSQMGRSYWLKSRRRK